MGMLINECSNSMAWPTLAYGRLYVLVVACYIRKITRIMRMRDSFLWKLYVVFFIMHFQNASFFWTKMYMY